MKKKLVENFYLPQIQRVEEENNGGRWRTPVWNLDQVNLNGRIYPRELAERIVSENPVTCANDGHDRLCGEYGCAVAVCKNPRIENNQLWVDIEFVDKQYQEKLEVISSQGVKIGVSSVGYGEVDDSGRIVPESYELVRFLDFVTCPAGEVYATKESEGVEEECDEKQGKPTGNLCAEAMAERKSKLAATLSEFIWR